MRELMRQAVVPMTIILSLTALQIAINTKRKNRAKQLVRVVIAVAFAIMEIIAYLLLEQKIITFLNDLGTKLMNMIPQELYPIIDNGAQAIFGKSPNLTELSQTPGASLFDMKDIFNVVGISLIMNILFYTMYVVLRMVPGLLNRILMSRVFLFQQPAEIFYEYDEEYDQWFIREKWINVREMFKYISWIGAAATGLALAVTWYLQTQKGISVLIFPAMAHMVIVEFYGFINGFTKTEYEHEIGGDNSYAQKISNFYKIREIYEKLFPREVLVSHTGCEYAATSSTMDLLESLRAGDRDEAIVSHFFTLNETEENYDNDCIIATKELMKGENVVFFNPFYRDLGKYIVLPVMSNLLKGKNCLIIVGRNSAKEDIKNWMNDLLWETSKIKSMWRVADLNFKHPECEIGVLGFSQLYDENVLEANREFLRQVKFVIILEASLMLNTGQVGLSILSNQMVNYSDRPAYCILDRMTDGLVDTMSHLLQSEITKVVAPPVSRNLHTGMAWNADGDYLRQKLFGKQTRYLGNGTELAAVAIKNQVTEVSWFSERKAPVRDIKWIAGQYFPAICQYMNLPIQQQSIYDKIKFISNIWSVPENSEQFLIAEDEFVNMFSTMRTFLSRGKEQTFVNILSENYLLRDYMRCNPKLFMSNPNAIPSLVPDYAKTERNTLIKLLLLMSYDSVTEEEIRNEFSLLGIETDDVLHSLTTLLTKYTEADSTIFTIKTVTYDSDGLTIRDENIYSITPEKFDEFFGDDLRNAYYVCEEEKSESEYIESKLFGHVTQTILPGQMVTYDGKYYIAEYVTPNSGVILRRASNLYDGRRYYRQIRKYHFDDCVVEENLISKKTIMDVELTKFRANFNVHTTGYLQMNSNEDLRSARMIDFSEDPTVDSYRRKYCNKAILRIKLPEIDDKVRFTICLLLSEMMRSVFPEGWPYIAVLCTIPEDIDGMLNHILYEVDGAVEDEYIYIVEDSNLDLGLLEAIEKNFMFFMEVVTDYLYWHFEKMKEAPAKDPEIHTTEFPAVDFKKRKRFTEFAKKVRKLFGGKKEEKVEIEDVEKVEEKKRKPEEQPESAQTEENGAEGEASKGTDTSDKKNKKDKKDRKKKKKWWKRGDDDAAEETEETPAEDDGQPAKEFGKKDDDSEEEAPKTPEVKPEDTEAQGAKPESAKPEGEATEVVLTEGKKTDGKQPESAPSEGTQLGDGLGDTFGKGFGKDSSDSKKTAKESTETAAPTTVFTPENADQKFTDEDYEEEDENAPADVVAVDGTDIFDTEGSEEDAEYFEECFEELGITPLIKSRYQEECYLKFGFNEIDKRLHLDEVKRYLTVRGFSNNSLTKARKRDVLEPTILDLNAVNHCDFCGMPLSGVSYQRLTDGRIRCNDCSSSAITSVDEFKKIFHQSLEMMQNFFGIEFKKPIFVKTADARAVARGSGAVFTPTTGFAARVLGYAQRKGKVFNLVVENGSPRLATIETMVHELTHIWQYINWDDREIKKNYPERWQRDAVYEGMAVWVSIQYLYLIGETSYAMQQEILQASRDDIYGIGFRLYVDRYPLIKDSSLVSFSPFTVFPPL